MKKQDIFKIIKFFIKDSKKSNILIGVDGGQGSGKTTFIKKLYSELNGFNNFNIIIVETDDYLVERKARENLPESFFYSIKNLSKLFDFKKFTKTVKLLTKTKNKNLTLNYLYNRKTGKNDRKEIKKISDKNIIIIGGPYLLSPTLPKFDLKIFLDVKVKNRLNNTLQRVLKNKSRTKKSQLELFKKFENFFLPYFENKLDIFDLVIDNNNWKNRFIIKNKYMQTPKHTKGTRGKTVHLR